MPSMLKDSSTSLTGARQTMMSWARVIDSLEAVPEIFKTPYQALAGTDGAVPYTVLAPAQASARNRKSRERLLCEIGGTFFVLERNGQQVDTTGYRYADIRSLELGNVLLYSWFSFSGRTVDGIEAAASVEFNEATRRHFEPFFNKMRPAPAGSGSPDLKLEQDRFDTLALENFKFMNFARGSLVRGERVIQFLYQPLNRLKTASVLGRGIYLTLTLAHLTILTDKEIILIGDAEGIAEKQRSKYGGVWRYLPLRCLDSISLEDQPRDILRLTFHVSPGIRVERLFEASRRGEIENLKKAVETLPV